MGRTAGRTAERAAGLAGGLVWLAGCEGPQSALQAGGRDAEAILELTLVLFVGAG